MAVRHRTHTHRYEEAQPADHSDRDPARRTRAQMQRAKENARYRMHEATASARNGDERAGPGIGERQGEAA